MFTYLSNLKVKQKIIFSFTFVLLINSLLIAILYLLAKYNLPFKNLFFVLVIIGLLISIVIAIRLSNYFVNTIHKLKSSLKNLSEGKLSTEIQSVANNDEFGDIIHSFNTLNVGLHQTSSFANDIGKGNFDIDFKPLGKDDILGN